MTARRDRGELETTVLKRLWASGVPLSARDLQSSFQATDPDAVPALTTLLTVLDRLVKKGTVVKTPASTAGFVFAAAYSEESFTADAMFESLLGSSDRAAVLLRFAGELDDADVSALRRALGPVESVRSE